MRNFSFNDDEYHDSYEEMDEEEERGFFPVEVEIFHMAQLDLAAADINQKILAETIRMLENSWLWRFKPLDKKLEIIKQTYAMLTKLVEEATNKEEE